MNLIGAVLGGRYEIAEKLGAGGMAIVYRAQDTLLQRPVTVKVLRGEFAADENVVRRFRREAQAAASLSHPNIVGVYDVGRQDDVHYIVMEYVQGESLKEVITERGPLPPEEAVRIARQIAEALRHAHAHRIIHRDVKPHNVLITPEGRVKVADFGIAGAATGSTVTYPGALLGTVYYFSPEQAQGRYGDERSDLYALGVVLYEMLTGQVPFEGESPVSVALKHIREPVPSPRQINPRVPPAAERVVLKAMAKEGERRYQSATEMLRDLEALQRRLAEWRSRGQPLPAGEDRDLTQVIAAATPAGGQSRQTTLPGVKPGATAAQADGAAGAAGGERAAPVEPPAPPEPGPEGRVDRAATGGPLPAGESAAGPYGPGDRYYEFEGDDVTEPPRRFRLSKPLLWVASFVVFFLLVGAGLFWVVQWFEVPEVTVPNVVGLEVTAAGSRLAEYSLNSRVVSYDFNPTVPSGVVTAQDPAAGVTVKSNRTISLWVSKGPQLIDVVPDVSGLTWREAKINLEAIGLTVSEADFTYQNSETLEKDRVISQDPKPGTRNLPRGTKAYLVVSLGPQAGTVVVPNFVGQTIDQARALLPTLGLTEGTITTVQSTQAAGTIVDQSPAAGTQVATGTAVVFSVAGSGGGSDTGGGATHHQSLLTFKVPAGAATQNVRIVVTDSQGPRVVYDKDHAVGVEGKVLVDWTGDTLHVQVYYAGTLGEDYTLTPP